MNITSYLTFNGNCREAMTFYNACLGGQLHFQTVGDSPLAANLPGRMKKAILHATLTLGEMVIMGSDMVSEKGLVKGNAVSLMLHCNSEDEIKDLYKKLSKGGEAIQPIRISFWGALLGDLLDKYGNQWLLHYAIRK
jgi:PhnB protein